MSLCRVAERVKVVQNGAAEAGPVYPIKQWRTGIVHGEGGSNGGGEGGWRGREGRVPLLLLQVNAARSVKCSPAHRKRQRNETKCAAGIRTRSGRHTRLSDHDASVESFL